ncbi:DUF6358 family protein [Parapedobacter soli]|uniref:DUF6358 family protein n=1 Tax=Parapedobacter soli TaxID=416955 RepID=UPI0021C94A7B|nr:DUF6358 family protein [Parapedobacter soli]
MKKYFLYNVMLNIGLILMGLAVWAAYRLADYTILAITVAIFIVLVWLKIRLLKQVRQFTKDS